MDLSWHKELADKWLASAEQRRLPHAVLLAGPSGVGKRAAAAWMVSRKLDNSASSDLPVYPFERPQYADLHWIEPPEGKASILIDQVRALVTDLSLTSYEGRGKAAVIEPANAMTSSAANSLLKTLEEPPGDTLLVLIADRVGRLPATIFSRCQRLDIPVPALDVALAWLDRLHPGGAWRDALAMVGNAPIAALAAAQHLEASRGMARDLEALINETASPIDVAASWAKRDPVFVFEWLARQVQGLLKATCVGAKAAHSVTIAHSVQQRMDRRNLFCYLDIINRVRGQPIGSYNVQLTLEGLLIDWATGLNNLQREALTG